MLEKVEWGKFKLEKLFNKVKVKSLKYKTTDLPEKKEWIFDLPALTAWIQNQWLNNFVPWNESTILKNVISISANWANTWATFYQKNEFTVLQDAYAIDYVYTGDKLNDRHYLFLTSAISKTIFGNYEWTNKAGWERIKSQKIELPIKNWKIDFDFMESFIEELETKRIGKLNNYLEVTWLKDYNLTNEEEKILEDFESEKIVFWEFYLWWENGLFDINPTKYYKLSNDEIISENWNIPLVTNSSVDNWVMWFSNLDSLNIWNTLTCSDTTMWAETMYYQANNFIWYSHIQHLVPKFDNFTRNIAFFIITSSRIATNKKYNYWNKFNRDAMNNTLIQLPIKNNKPDYKLIETLISAIQKLVIKDVVLYAEK